MFVPYLTSFGREYHLPTTGPLYFANGASKATTSTSLCRVNAHLHGRRRSFTVRRVTHTSLRAITMLFTGPLSDRLLPFKGPFQEVGARRIHPYVSGGQRALLVVAKVGANTRSGALFYVRRFVEVLAVEIVVLTRGRAMGTTVFVGSKGKVSFVIPSGVVNFKGYSTRPNDSRLFGEHRGVNGLLTTIRATRAMVATQCSPRRFPIQYAILYGHRHKVPHLFLRHGSVHRHVREDRVKVTRCRPHFLHLRADRRHHFVLQHL